MAIIVSDTSPVRALDFLGHLDLLIKMFEMVIVPPTVVAELTRPRPRFRGIDVLNLERFEMRIPAREDRVERLMQQLQRGEAEAIALAEEIRANLLIDERIGRKIASAAGIRVTGVVGILVEAKSRQLLPAVLPLLERLRTELGFFLSGQLLADVRRQCGE